ncbi:MAG: FMN-binding protein, partial [Actinomycetota bacterium]
AAPATAAPVTAAPATAAGVKDGTYAGAGSSNRFGTVQVQVVYAGGQITDVQMLSYPNGDSRSYRISQIALPQLISETVSAQSASVRTVSGATYTSKSYKKTLQSAIDAAKAASGVA